MIKTSELEGWDWGRMFLEPREVELTQPQDTEEDVAAIVKQIESQHFLAYLPRDFPCCPSQKKELKYSFDSASKILIPLSMASHLEPQNLFRIKNPSRNRDDNNAIQINFIKSCTFTNTNF